MAVEDITGLIDRLITCRMMPPLWGCIISIRYSIGISATLKYSLIQLQLIGVIFQFIYFLPEFFSFEFITSISPHNRI